MSHQFLHGSPLLLGDNTTPGLQVPEELNALLPTIFKAVRDFGCDFHPTIVQMLTYDEMSEIASYGGFPVRYPHWKWGMEYEEMQTGYMYGKFRIYEMVVNCASLKMKVPTRRGTINAGDVVAGDTVYGAAGPRVVAKVERQKAVSLKRIKINGYAHDLVCTPNHKWRVMSKTGLEWVEAKDIKSGDLLVGNDNYSFNQNNPAKIDFDPKKVVEDTASNVRWCLKDVSLPTRMTLELAELMGALIGDGSIGVKSKENMLSVAVGYEDESYCYRLGTLFNSVFGSIPDFNGKESIIDVIFCSKIATAYLNAAGIPTGCTYHTKRIPSSVWASSNEYRAAFLRGLFDTDGCASDSLTFSGYNNDLVADVQLMLAEMGINSFIAIRNNGIGKNGDLKEITTLRIKGRESLFRFRNRINFSILRKSNDLSKLTDTENCVSGGIPIPFIQNFILEIGKDLTVHKNGAIGRSIENMKKNSDVGFNALYGFVMRAIACGYNQFREVYNYISLNYMEVSSVEDSDAEETVDIALFHNDHDFVMNGLLSHNTNPCYLYCLDSNTLLDNVTVVAHALFHNDFFKNNIFFKPTSQNMMNQFANHGTKIRRYMNRWGQEKVMAFIDSVISIETLIDPAAAWNKRVVQDPIISDHRTYKFPSRLKVDEGHEYLESYVNPKEWTDKQNLKIEKGYAAKEIDLFTQPTKDIFGYLKDHAPLKPWQQDIMAMLYEEAIYFSPQRMTKTCNEAHASWGDYKMIAEGGLCGLGQPTEDSGIIEYAMHKMGVLGGKYSMNPYKLGFTLWRDIEDRWNKGKFGTEYEECTNIKQKEDWDLKLGLGKEKVFDVRKNYNDLTLIMEYFTEEFCEKNEFFEWEKFPNGEYKIKDRNYKNIRKKLIQRHLNGGLPEIKLVDPNYKGRGYMLLQHSFEGRILLEPYVKATLSGMYRLWTKEVFLVSRNSNGDEIVYGAYGPNEEDVKVQPRAEHEKGIS